jgi:signal transduction histidine kinase/DNA-binding CsgD family transcriptional regulator
MTKKVARQGPPEAGRPARQGEPESSPGNSSPWHSRLQEQLEHQLRTARDNLRVLAGLLLQAQEEERRRIAREMHDDWTQRLAVLAIDTARMEQEPGLGPSARAQLQAMRGELVSLSEDVHALSRQLHPSILDDLGLADALLSECASFSRREGIAVDYRPEGVPASVPKEVALCVYRVAQEALRNIARHARVTTARVSLVGTGRDLLLSVQDEGAGFDPAGARSRPALGLSSMEERVRLIQAELSVRSAPGRGTTVTLRVPLAGDSEPQRLTPRQREVLQLFAEGRSAKEVAAVLKISPRTAEFHKARILEALGIRTTAGLVQYAIRHGIVPA